jgi:HK97 family phage prohead protease|nr:MAG TPA: prohead serine protease [Caudoviricetes sp.]
MKEIRTAEVRATEPTADGKDALIIVGTPIVYDTPTQINDLFGSYTEVIKRGALVGCDLTDSRLLVNHDLTRIPLARTPKTMQFNITEKGLEMRAELPDTEEAKTAYTAVKRGDLTGMSFSFTVPEGGDSYDAQTNTRTITKIDKVYEVSLVNFPAYPTASAEARSARTEGLKKLEARNKAKILCNIILMKEGK